jgi:hypothetical protein
MIDRSELGRTRFGIPATETLDALNQTLDESPWKALNREAIDYYLERVPMSWLPEMIDAKLSTKQLDALPPAAVKSAILLLTRDMLRHNREELTPEEGSWNGDWIERFFATVAERAQVEGAVLAKWPEPFDIDDPFERASIPWAIEIAKPFGVEPEKLALLHGTIVEGVIEDVVYGDGSDDEDYDDDEEEDGEEDEDV